MKVRDVIVQSVEKWKQQHPPSELEILIEGQVNQVLSNSIIELIGVEKKWYGDTEIRWNSVVDFDVKQLVATKVREWIVQNIGTLPVPSDKVCATLLEEYKDRYLDEFRRELHQLAQENAETDVRQLVKDAIGQAAILDAEYDVVFEIEEPLDDDDWE